MPHPNFGKQLKAKMDSLGIENVYIHTAESKGVNVTEKLLDFIQKRFAQSQN